MRITKERAIDRGESLNLLIKIGEFCKENSGFLVLTGSYGIALVTENPELPHNDLDLQLYFPISSSFAKNPFPTSGLIEINIFSYTKRSSTDNESILLEGVKIDGYGGREFQIPLRKVNPQLISDLSLEIFSKVDGKSNLYVKPLPYQIATWIIRLYGTPLFQRRKPQERDYQFLNLLLRQQFNYREVCYWIRRHPQSFNFNESQLNQLENILLEYL